MSPAPDQSVQRLDDSPVGLEGLAPGREQADLLDALREIALHDRLDGNVRGGGPGVLRVEKEPLEQVLHEAAVVEEHGCDVKATASAVSGGALAVSMAAM